MAQQYRTRTGPEPDVWNGLPNLPPIHMPPYHPAANPDLHPHLAVRTPTFACPFSKRSLREPVNIWCRPMRTEDWTRLSGIVEHICTRHHPPIPDSSRLWGSPNIHENRESSDPFGASYIPATIPLIDGQQWKKIRSLSSWGSGTEPFRWYEIWDILFPQLTRPPSPFLYDESNLNETHHKQINQLDDGRCRTLSPLAPAATPSVFALDGAATDSGYASAPGLLDLHTTLSQKGDDKTDDTASARSVDNEAQTIYSTTAALIPSAVSQSILDVCGAIYDRIRSHPNADDLARTNSSWISRLIKAFAIELGLEESRYGPANLGIMHFVHKHHDEISTQLRIIIQGLEDEGRSERQKIQGNGMSLVDKMNLWGRKSSEVQDVDADFQDRDLFVGVDEDDDYLDEDHESSSLLSTYTKEILRSAAYGRFIDRVLRELSLHRDSDGPQFRGTWEIRRTILRQLPTGIISKNRRPRTYTAEFRLPWATKQAPTDAACRTDSCPISPGEDVGKRLVIVMSSTTRIQAATVAQYLDQTWPAEGMQVLSLLQDILKHSTRNESRSITMMPFGQTETKATLTPSGVVVQVSGPPHFIAERGEVIAWLVAAVQKENQAGIESTPFISTENHVVAGQTENHLPSWRFGVNHEALTTGNPLVQKIQAAYEILQEHPIAVVRGFPTKHRPDDYHGVEIRPELLARVIWAGLSKPMQALIIEGMGCAMPRSKPAFPPGNGLTNLSDLNTGLFLTGNNPNGFSPALRLLKKMGAVMYWHAPLSAPTCKCPKQAGLGASQQWSDTTPDDIRRFRHIVATCQPDTTAARSQAVHDSRAPAKNAEESGGEPLSSTTTTSSQTTAFSADSGAFSISEASTDMMLDALATHYDLVPVVDTVTAHILANYKKINPATRRGGAVQCNTGGGDTDSHQPSATSTTRYPGVTVTFGGSSARPKRVWEEEGGDGDSEGDEDRRRQKKRQKPEHSDEYTARKLLACPFWKLDPRAHKDCFKMKLDKISRVKQHLTRKHLPAFYCERCMLVLPNEDAHTAHIQVMSCSFQAEQFNGITHRQQRELSKKSNPNLSEPDQWFAIWRIVFPNTPRPVSAYMDPDLSEDLCQFKEFAELHGPALIEREIISSNLEGTGTDMQSHSGLALQQVIAQGLNRIFENWLGHRPRNNSQQTMLSAQMSSSQGLANLDTNYTVQPQRSSMSSYPDSGVAMQGPQRGQLQAHHPRSYQPAATTSWPASFHNYSLGRADAGAEDVPRTDALLPPHVHISLSSEDAPSPRAVFNNHNVATGEDPEWERYLTDLFPGGSGLT